MKIPEKIDLKKLEEAKRKNFEERIGFIEEYAEWIKRTPNKVWSKQQREIVG